MTEIDDRLRDHYRSQDLTTQDLASITQSTANRQSSSGFLSSLAQSRGYLWGAVALLVLSLTFGFHQYGTHTERTSRTLQEAAMNHSTRLSLEFEGDSISEIDQKMSQLPFKVALPEAFGEKFALLGARYCTINGELAAHVKFIDRSTDKQMSLFMARSVDELRSINDKDERIDGVNVKVWNETGLFYAIASRSPLQISGDTQ